MIIEFVGLMGAGKTTLHRRAVRRLEALDRSFWTSSLIEEGSRPGHQRAVRAFTNGSRILFARPRRFAFRALASWRSRGLFSIAVYQLLKSGRPYRDRLKGLRWFLTDLGKHQTARSNISPKHIVLFDEGLVQRVFNIFIHGSGEIDVAGLRDYARVLPLPDVLIYLVVDSEVAVRRTQARPSSSLSMRFRALDSAQLSRVFADAARALDVLVGEVRIADRRRVNVIVIDTNDLDVAKAKFDAQVVPLLVR